MGVIKMKKYVEIIHILNMGPSGYGILGGGVPGTGGE